MSTPGGSRGFGGVIGERLATDRAGAATRTRVGRRRRVTVLTRFAAAAACIGFAAPTPAVAVELPVTFEVTNTSASSGSCAGDGARYPIRGHLVAPPGALAGPGPRTVSVYLHGFESREWMWRFKAVPGYDYASQMAQRGHVSVVIDQLGYGASGKPPGFATCLQTEAEALHQVIADLRSGAYSLAGRPSLRFSKVVVVGHDIGGAVAEIEAYTHKDIDALALVSYADQGLSNTALYAGGRAAARCATGGDAAGPDDPVAYTHLGGSDQELRDGIWRRASPDVAAAGIAARAKSPCGEILSIPVTLATNPLRLGSVAVPVLIVLMRDDAAFYPQLAALQESHFTGSNDVTTVMLDEAGHFPMLEPKAAAFRVSISDWLARRELVSSPTSLALHTPRVIRPTRSGRMTVRVACHAAPGSVCGGTLHITSARGTATRTATLGVQTFHLAAGRRARVSIRLSPAAYRLLQRRRRLRVDALAVAQWSDGAPARATKTVTLVVNARA